MFATPPSLANPRRRQAPSSSLARCPPSPHPRGHTRSKAPLPRASPPDPRPQRPVVRRAAAPASPPPPGAGFSAQEDGSAAPVVRLRLLHGQQSASASAAVVFLFGRRHGGDAPRPELLPRIQGRSAPSSVAPQGPRLLPRRAPGFLRRRTAALPRWSASASSTGSRARPRLPPSSSSLGGATAATGRTPGMREYVETAREMARRPDGGPPRWFTPLECGGAGQRVPGAPTLLYLPGDGEEVLCCVHRSGSRCVRGVERLSEASE